jgi:hypothetical protein
MIAFTKQEYTTNITKSKALIFTNPSIACDYTPSNLIGGKASGAIGVGAGATAATGLQCKIFHIL